jgi:hypothetical protein
VTRSTLAPAASDPATAQTSSGVVNVEWFPVSPSGANSRAATSRRSTPDGGGGGSARTACNSWRPSPCSARACSPLLAQPREVDRLLRFAGRDRGDACGGEPGRAERLHVLDQGLPPRRERAQRLGGDAVEFGHALHRLRPAHAAQAAGQLAAKVGS